MVAPPGTIHPRSARSNSCYPTAIDADYRKARTEVRKLGLDPDSIPICDPNNGFLTAIGRDAGLLQIWKL